MFRRILLVLVFAGPLLVVGFAVLMGASALADALRDTTAARALFWVAMVCLMLLTADLVLLVLALGIRALDDRRPDE